MFNSLLAWLVRICLLVACAGLPGFSQASAILFNDTGAELLVYPHWRTGQPGDYSLWVGERGDLSKPLEKFRMNLAASRLHLVMVPAGGFLAFDRLDEVAEDYEQVFKVQTLAEQGRPGLSGLLCLRGTLTRRGWLNCSFDPVQPAGTTPTIGWWTAQPGWIFLTEPGASSGSSAGAATEALLARARTPEAALAESKQP